jgi:hypothetical protein
MVCDHKLRARISDSVNAGREFLQPQSPICQVFCTDGSSYKVLACIKGSIIEINKRLLEQPQLLSSKARTDGFIGIIMPKPKEAANCCSKLLKPDEYAKKISSQTAADVPTAASATSVDTNNSVVASDAPHDEASNAAAEAETQLEKRPTQEPEHDAKKQRTSE